MISETLTHRKATIEDLENIIKLLKDDELGQTREVFDQEIEASYKEAFRRIDKDPSHYLMIVEMSNQVVGTCHLTLLPSLTFKGANRLQIEAVRVTKEHRQMGIGSWMINEAIQYGRTKGASIIQLSMNKQRQNTIEFYQTLGFKSTHEGMKLYLEDKHDDRV